MLDSYLKIWEDQGVSCCMPEDESALDAAVSHYLDTSRDSLVHMTQINGDHYVIRASQILAWRLVTSTGRRKDMESKAAQAEEERTLKAEFGMWETD